MMGYSTERVCPGCGKTFTVTSKHPKQKSCSPACGYTTRPRRERYVWADATDDIVRRGYERGSPISDIAGELGMTAAAVANRGRALGLQHRYALRTLAERFHDYVSPEPNSGCWLWAGSCDRKGYGQFRISADTLKYASHIALQLDGRSIPDGMQACHHCDNPGCVNPAHLFIGTPKDNTADMLRKGRGSPPPISKPGQHRKRASVL